MVDVSRRMLLKLAASVPPAMAAPAILSSGAIAAAKGKTITAVMHSDLRIIDPGFTTAYITRDHGYMVYDTLLGIDSSFKVRDRKSVV